MTWWARQGSGRTGLLIVACALSTACRSESRSAPNKKPSLDLTAAMRDPDPAREPVASEPGTRDLTSASEAERASMVIAISATARVWREPSAPSKLLVEHAGLDLQFEDRGADYERGEMATIAAPFVNVLRADELADGFVMVRGDKDPASTRWVETQHGRIRCIAPLTEPSRVDDAIRVCRSATYKAMPE